MAIRLRVIPDGEGCWPDLVGKIVVEPVEVVEVAGFEGGMQSGFPSVAFRFHLPDGKVLIFETSLKVLLSASDIFKKRYGDPRIKKSDLPLIVMADGEGE